MADRYPTNHIDSYRPKPHMTETELFDAYRNAVASFPEKFNKRSSFYLSVTAFIVTWDGDYDQEWYKEEMKWASRVLDVFEKTYHYKTERIVLDDKDINPVETLTKTIHNTTANKTNDDLVIFVYSGHGKQGDRDYRPDLKDVPEHMKTELEEEAELLLCGKNNYIPFNPFRKEVFDQAPFDALIIMDCCYASTAAIGQSGKELIAACPVGRTAPGGERGLLANICQILEHAAAQHEVYSTCQLYTALIERAWCLHRDGAPIMRETPIHTNLQPLQVPIILAPLAERGSDITQKASSMIYGPCTAKAILSVDLEEGQRLSSDSMRRFIQHLKLDNYVQVLNVFQTKSTLAIFEVTIDLWYCLQPHPAIQLLALSRPERLPEIVSPDITVATAVQQDIPASHGSQATLVMRSGNVPKKTSDSPTK